MIQLKIAGEKFEAPYKLTDIPLYRYAEYLEWREENLPQILKDLESIEGETVDEIIDKRRARYEAITEKEEQELLNEIIKILKRRFFTILMTIVKFVEPLCFHPQKSWFEI
jgi:hypothetical protein